MLIVPGPASEELAHRVSDILSLPTAKIESKTFPDGDSYFKVNEDVIGQDLAVIQSTYPNQDRNLMQLFILLDGLRDLGCKRVFSVVPYLAYMRQDKRFLAGEMISGHSILKLLKCLQVERLITIDIHNREILTPFGQSGVDISAMPLMAKWIGSREWRSPLIVSPDKGARHRAEAVSKALGTDYAVGQKTRDRHTGKVTVELDSGLNVHGREAVIVDEAIARGDTVIETAKILLGRGAKNVTALCTHGLFLENAVARIRDAGVKEVISTDTIPGPNSKISVAPIIADFIRPLVS